MIDTLSSTQDALGQLRSLSLALARSFLRTRSSVLAVVKLAELRTCALRLLLQLRSPANGQSQLTNLLHDH